MTKDRPVRILGFEDMLDQDLSRYGLIGSPTAVERMFAPPETEKQVYFEGTAAVSYTHLALNTGMTKFPGVIIFSSRDHQIVETTANRIMEIVNGKLIDKITTYDEYLASDEMARKRQVFTVTDSEEADD